MCIAGPTKGFVNLRDGKCDEGASKRGLLGAQGMSGCEETKERVQLECEESLGIKKRYVCAGGVGARQRFFFFVPLGVWMTAAVICAGLHRKRRRNPHRIQKRDAPVLT
jgi:hypothetical protein